MAKYVRIRELGVGGQGSVWLGRAEDGSHVAIKYLRLTNNEIENSELRRRFQREVKTQSSLKHPGVLRIIGSNLKGARPFFVMDLAESSLRDDLPLDADPKEGLAEERVWQVFDEVLGAVEFAHENGIVHRDLKPENILFRDDRTVLTDFGMIKRHNSGSTLLTQTGQILGTIGYIAPEQFTSSKDADSRCDVYALGRILYEMLTGIYSPSTIDVLAAPAKFRHLISKAIETDPSKRFKDAAEMRREFSLLKAGAVETQSPTQALKSAIEKAASGDTNSIDDIFRIIIENDTDFPLFSETIVQIPESVLAQAAIQDSERYLAVVKIVDSHADGSFAFEFTDSIARLHSAMYLATDDIRVHATLLNRLLVLGADHNRWFVRDVFVNLVKRALQQPHYAPCIADILRSNQSAIAFVRDEFSGISLPPIVQHALAA